jgi:hypothetical protein
MNGSHAFALTRITDNPFPVALSLSKRRRARGNSVFARGFQQLGEDGFP